MTLYFYIYNPETHEFREETAEVLYSTLLVSYYSEAPKLLPTGYYTLYKSEINSIPLLARYSDTYISDHPAAEEALEALYNHRLEKAAAFKQEADNQTTIANKILDLMIERYR